MNNKAFTLVETLVAIALVGIISAGITSMLINQHKETRAVAETLAAQDLYKSVLGSLTNSDVCRYMLSKHTYNIEPITRGEQVEVDLGEDPVYINMVGEAAPGEVLIKKGDVASAYARNLYVSKIRYKILAGTISGNTGTFKGEWLLDFDTTKSIRPMRPLSISSIITLDTTNPAAATLINCMNDASSPFLTQSCRANEVITGYDEFGMAICKPNFPSCPAGEAFSELDADGNPICIRQVVVGGCPADSAIKAISSTAPPVCVTTNPENARCGSSNGQELEFAPTSNLCAVGEPTRITGTGPWGWACAGVNGGTTTSCMANEKLPVCGSAHNSTQPSIPASNLCAVGTASAVVGVGPWTWSCANLAGRTVGCRADKQPGIISIRSASYGRNCGIRAGNVTGTVQGLCNGRRSCSFTAGNGLFGDPIDGCRKTFEVTYACDSDPARTASYGPRKHEGYSVTLFCN